MKNINVKKTINIKDFDQKPYIEVMSSPDNGIYVAVVTLDTSKIKVDSVRNHYQ